MSEKSSTFAAAVRKNEHLRIVSLAQLVEQLTLNQWVEGSSPSGDTRKDRDVYRGPFVYLSIYLSVFVG